MYQRCEKMRPTLFRLASDTEDNDEALGKNQQKIQEKISSVGQIYFLPNLILAISKLSASSPLYICSNCCSQGSVTHMEESSQMPAIG